MANQSPSHQEVSALRQLMSAYVQERLQAKLDKLRDDDHEQRQQLQDSHQLAAWLAGAARRVKRIQLASHLTKPIHPSARGGTNLRVKDYWVKHDHLVGTHSLGEQQADDVALDNAADLAHMDIYGFLKLNYDGKSLLDHILAGDSRIHAAFSSDAEQAYEWMQALASITQSKTGPASHTLAKQLYFPLEDGSYNLLAPLFPTALVQAVHTTIREDRFGEAAKAAREAHSKKLTWDHGFKEYPDLAIQRIGGAQPQNVSYFNYKMRQGENWLLASMPPAWQPVDLKPPLSVQSVFGKWLLRRQPIARLISTLREFLRKTAHNNMQIRQTRADLVASIIDEVLVFATELRELPPGWSAQPECRLDDVEALWLDQRREQHDEEFRKRLLWDDWLDEICARFGRWLNAGIRTRRTPMGEAEFTQWKDDLAGELGLFRLELGDAD